MILKELDPFHGTEPFELAGRRAEEQMAFYLKRYFSESKKTHILNDFRFEYNGQSAQIDHLLIHRRGLMVIESKSVTSEVRINERGEWSRLWDGTWKGMPSPLQQAHIQLHLLWSVLDASNKELLGKLLGFIQRGFGAYRYDEFCAISDTGIVERPKPKAYPTVWKADQLCDKVLATLEKYEGQTTALGVGNTMFNPLNWGSWHKRAMFEFTEKEHTAISDFLLGMHKPKIRADISALTSTLPPTSKVLVLPANTPPNPTLESPAACAGCAAHLSQSVMNFCRAYPGRFGGRAHCMDCQKKHPVK